MSFELYNEDYRFSIPPLEVSVDYTNPPNWITNISPILSTNVEMSFECELGPDAAKLLGLDLSNAPDMTNASVIFKSPYQKQIRRHKKKRINKKWNKRYGPRYITVFKLCQIDGVQFESSGHDFTIVGERARFITPNAPLYI